MSDRPICNRLVTSLLKETAYGTAIVDGSLTTMYALTEPVVPDLALDLRWGNDILKEHEFEDPGADAFMIVFQDATLSLENIPMNAEFAGWAFASAFGRCTSAQILTSGDYTHACKPALVCTSAQLPSRTIGVVYSGTSSVGKKYKGCVVNTLAVRVNDKGRAIGSVQFVTDGSESDGSSISIPAALASKNFYYGIASEFKYANYGESLVDNSTKLRSFELTINNNILVDEAKKSTLATTGVLPMAEIGSREINCAISLFVNEASAEYTAAKACTMKVATFRIVGPMVAPMTHTADLLISLPQHRWVYAGRGFDGTRKYMNFNTRLYWNVTDDTCITVTVTNRDTSYLTTP